MGRLINQEIKLYNTINNRELKILIIKEGFGILIIYILKVGISNNFKAGSLIIFRIKFSDIINKYNNAEICAKIFIKKEY